MSLTTSPLSPGFDLEASFTAAKEKAMSLMTGIPAGDWLDEQVFKQSFLGVFGEYIEPGNATAPLELIIRQQALEVILVPLVQRFITSGSTVNPSDLGTYLKIIEVLREIWEIFTQP